MVDAAANALMAGDAQWTVSPTEDGPFSPRAQRGVSPGVAWHGSAARSPRADKTVQRRRIQDATNPAAAVAAAAAAAAAQADAVMAGRYNFDNGADSPRKAEGGAGAAGATLGCEDGDARWSVSGLPRPTNYFS